MVYHDTTTDEENDVYKGGMGDADNPSDANWFKLRDVKNEITFKKQEIEKLRKDMALLGTSTENAKNLHEEQARRDDEKRKKDTEMRKLIKEEKDRYRDLSTKIRVEGKQDMKVFEKFVNAHDERLVLKKKVMHEVSSPPNNRNSKLTSGGMAKIASLKLLTPQVDNS